MEFLEHSIGVERNLLLEREQLIAFVNSRPEWKAGIYDNKVDEKMRKCRTFSLTQEALTDQVVAPWDASVRRAFHQGAREYQAQMPFLELTSDEGYFVMRYTAGDFIEEHSDLAYNTRTVSGVLFLNDEFTGGELVFPQQKIRVKPEPGMGIFFPSFWNYPHKVDRILSGTRYSITTLFGGNTLTKKKE